MLDMDVPKLTIAEAAAIAGAKPVTASLWYRNNWLGWKTDKRAHVAGATTVVSARTVLALAIAVKLRNLGMPPKAACRAARRFTDLSNDHEAPGFSRDPGELFERSTTYLLAFPSGETRIIRGAGPASPKGPATLDDTFLQIGHRDGGWALLLDFVHQHVSAEMSKYADARRSGGAP